MTPALEAKDSIATHNIELWPEAQVFDLRWREDERGFFCELFNEARYPEAMKGLFIQDNLSFSKQAGVVRGLHYQKPPFAQGKLVAVPQGSVLDVIVDIREGSPHFGKAGWIVLSDKNQRQLYVPPGFAHGFCTLEDNTLVTYKVTERYDADSDSGIFWNDPALNIPWPFSVEEALLSPKDSSYPLLAEARPIAFHYEQ